MANSLVSPLPNDKIKTSVAEIVNTARYMIDAKGHRTDVVVSLQAWEKLLLWLEDQEDQEIAQDWLPRLTKGPIASGALAWQDIADEWDDE